MQDDLQEQMDELQDQMAEIKEKCDFIARVLKENYEETDKKKQALNIAYLDHNDRILRAIEALAMKNEMK